MKSRFCVLFVATILACLAAKPSTAAPDAGPCVPGGGYDSACDANQDGQITVTDIQLTAGHWNQTGTFTSDNNHQHLGQVWMGSGNPLVIQGAFGGGSPAPVILNNSLGSGLRIGSAAQSGVAVELAGNDGLFVCRTGSAGACTPSSENNGVEIGNSQHNGVRVQSAGYNGFSVGSAGLSGVNVGTASYHGVWVDSAGFDGVRVGSAGDAGLYIGSAGDDGVYVCSTGNASGCTPHASNNGFEVGAAEANGMYVHSAGTNGVYVNSAVNGMYVQSASTYGLQVNSAVTGVRVTTANVFGVRVDSAGSDGIVVGSAGNYAGNFTGNIYVSGDCIGCLLARLAVNTGEDTLQPGDVVAMDGIADSPFDNLEMLLRVRRASPGDGLVGVVSGRAEPVTSDESRAQTLVARSGEPAPAGEYVSVVIYGPVQVKASGYVAIGQRITIGQSDAVRALRRVTVQGVTLDEGGPSLGVALDTATDGLVWVLVNPQ